jgi:phosphoribosylformylglycinamidine cyclo-ligase
LYEDEYNSGIGSNGLTAARHDVLDHSYFDLYPETFDAEMKASLAYTGTKNVNDLFNNAPLNIGKLLLSPTRTYAPVMKVLIEKFFDEIHGAIHCSGGGQTKVLHYINKLHIVKENLFPVPPVFKLIQQESKTDWKEMYQVFNMGHRLEIYCDQNIAQSIIDVANSFNIEARIIGKCFSAEEKKVTINLETNSFDYF